MKRFKGLVLSLVMALSACSSGPRAPDWQVQAHGAAERYTSAYLAGSRAADAEWQRTRAAVAATAQPQRVARAELLRCALQVASLDWQPTCAGFEAFKQTALPADAAYADYLLGRWSSAALVHLGSTQRRVAEQGAKALPAMDEPLSRLLGAAVLLRSGNVAPTEQDALVALAYAMHDESPRFRLYPFMAERMRETLATVLGMPMGFAHVAEVDGVIVGAFVGVLFGDDATQFVNASCHRRWKAVNCRLFTAACNKSFDVHRRKLAGVEMAEAFGQCVRASECPLHWHLLIEQHADEQCRAVALQQAVGFDNARDVEVAGAWFRHTAG
jgi:hypothetical protein